MPPPRDVYAFVAVEHRQLAVDAIALANQARAITPAGADPLANTPHPPASNLRVEGIRLALHPLAPFRRRRGQHQPAMACVQIGFAHRPVTPTRNLIGRRSDRAPEIRDEATGIVHSLDAWHAGPGQQHRRGAAERLHEVRHITEPAPHFQRHAALATEVREWSGQHVAVPTSITCVGNHSPLLRGTASRISQGTRSFRQSE